MNPTPELADLLKQQIKAIQDNTKAILEGGKDKPKNEPKSTGDGGIASSIAKSFSGVFAVLDGAIKTVTASLGIFGVAIGVVSAFVQALNPGAVALLFQALADLVATVAVAFQPLVPILTDLVNMFAGAILPLMEALAPILEVLAQIVKDVLAPILTIIAEIFEILSPLLQIVAEALKLLEPIIKAVAEALRFLLRVITFGLLGSKKELGKGATAVTGQAQVTSLDSVVSKIAASAANSSLQGRRTDTATAVGEIADDVRSLNENLGKIISGAIKKSDNKGSDPVFAKSPNSPGGGALPSVDVPADSRSAFRKGFDWAINPVGGALEILAPNKEP